MNKYMNKIIEDLFKTKLVTDNKGNTKEIVMRPKKVLGRIEKYKRRKKGK